MITLLIAALIGGVATFVGLWSQGFLIALLCAPLGGSFAALLAGMLLAYVRSRQRSRAEYRLKELEEST
jgi:hypothetical protein